MPELQVAYRSIPSRFGDVVLAWHEENGEPKIVTISLPSRGDAVDESADEAHPPMEIDLLCDQIKRYLDGEAIEFPTSRLDPNTCTPFQWQVLLAERTIPRGRVCSYRQLATIIQNPKAARAVGSALARNPFPIIIPCHRTVRSDGSLGGFGGGLPMKRALLEMEGVVFDASGRVEPEFFWPEAE